MPRCARIKSYDSIFHIMVKSIVEAPLFKENTDKDLYLKLVKEYQKQYAFKVYAYCLMDNHGHFIIDANGADISKIMHGINLTYAQAYNKKYKRIGCLFHDRFKSKIVKDDRYIIALSAYIHNNSTDIEEYKKRPSEYQYSSLSTYLGLRVDPYKILDEGFVMRLFGKKKLIARLKYKNLIAFCSDKAVIAEIEFKDEKSEYRSERKILVRNFIANDIINYVAKITNTNVDKIHIKNSKNSLEIKAISIVLMRNLCNYRCKDMCKVIGNISQGRVSKLCSLGIKIIDEKDKYRNVINSFIRLYSA